MKSPQRVLLADDHAIVLEGLRRVLEPHFNIVGEVGDGHALVAAAARLRPDIIVADISMPLLNGIEAVRQIRKIDRKAKIVFLTMHPEVTYVSEALRAGGSAYVLKSSAGAELLEAIREALSGRMYVSPAIDKEAVRAQTTRASRWDHLQSELTPRQREVLQLLAEGRSLKEVAAVLNISIKTAEFHKYRIMKQLGIHSNAELTKYAVRLGMTGL
jgi:DNA-binding NarL/FixJ family response regulator